MSRAPSPGERSLFGPDVEVVSPRSVAELGEVVRAAERGRRRIVPAGLGAHPEAGDPPGSPPLLVSTERFDAIVQYQPDDFTIGVGAGVPLAALREELRRHRQEIVHDWAAGAGGTIGGLVARAPWSPRQGGAGPLHALVLGAEGVRGGGRPFKSGGMVVKNVAGYQVHKVCAGSSGTLGVLTRLNFRLRPIPARRSVGIAAFASAGEAATFATALRASRLEPAALALVQDHDTPSVWANGSAAAHVLWVFEGVASRVERLVRDAIVIAASAGVSPEMFEGADASAWSDRLAAFEEPPPDRAAGIARLSVLPSRALAAAQDLDGRLAARPRLRFGLLTDLGSGAVIARWRSPDGDLGAPLRDVVATTRSFEGAARLVHLPGALRAGWSRDLTPDPNATLAARIRAAFDPAECFARAAVPGLAAAPGSR